MQANPVGFHTGLTPHLKDEIIANVPGNYVIGQVARMTKIPKRTFARWLKRGEEEAEKEINSIFAQLWLEFEITRGNEIMSMLEDVRKRKERWQATWELLKSIAREDFGVESLEIKELSAKVEQLSNKLASFMENQAHGVLANGETDSKET